MFTVGSIVCLTVAGRHSISKASGYAAEAGVLTGTAADMLAPGQAAIRVQTVQALLALSQIAE